MPAPHPSHDAFLAAALPHLDVVHAIARRHVRDVHVAEDVAQETFLRAFAAYGSFHGTSMRAWLATICLNVVREQARRRASRPPEVLGGDPDEATRVAPADADGAVSGEERQRIGAALATLSAEQREAIVLVDVADLTFAEAAVALGCPRGTVLARVHRGRKRLAQLLVREEAAP